MLFSFVKVEVLSLLGGEAWEGMVWPERAKCWIP